MVTLKINGNFHTVDASPDMPLLWVLRDLLGMSGTKFGCGVALCGACQPMGQAAEVADTAVGKAVCRRQT